MIPNPNPNTWTWSPEVHKFAQESGVADYLYPLMAAAQRLFAEAQSIDVVLEHDPEIEDLSAITFELGVTIRDPSDYYVFSGLWEEQMLRICPRHLLHFFQTHIFPVQ